MGVIRWIKLNQIKHGQLYEDEDGDEAVCRCMCSGFSGGSELFGTADFYDHIHSDQRWVMILPMLYTKCSKTVTNIQVCDLRSWGIYKEVMAACR